MPQISQTLERQRHREETYSRMKQMEFSYLKFIIGNNSQATFYDICIYQKVCFVAHIEFSWHCRMARSEKCIFQGLHQ